MRRHRALIIGLAAVLSAAAQAQDVKIEGLMNVWQTQMLDSSLRNGTGVPYYNLKSEFKENGTNLRRVEIGVKYKPMDGVEFATKFDPTIGTGSTNPSIILDATLKFKITDQMDFMVGQFRPLQTMEATITPTAELLFNERSQIARVFGDKRDRGAVLSYQLADPKTFGAKLSVGVFNGMTEQTSGKTNDNNACKDYVARLEMNVGKAHKFGIYTLQGGFDHKDSTAAALVKFTPAAGWPTKDQIYAHKDKTTNYGAYYAFSSNGWYFDAEVMTGLLGRRAPLLGVDKAGRQHLDQKFLGYYATAGYTFGHHTLLARYDELNYNSGNQWYGTSSPYLTTGNPKFKEATLGYTYAFNVEKVKAANIKVNYIKRSSNILTGVPGKTGVQGGDTLMVGFQIAF